MDIEGNLDVKGNIATGGTVDGIDIATDVAANTSKTSYTDAAAVSANTAKITNATHTGEATGGTTLTIDKTAVSNKSLVVAAVGDHVLINDASDSDNLKKVTVQTIVDLAGGGGAVDLDDLNDCKADTTSFFVGTSAGSADDGTANYNTGFGYQTLQSVTSAAVNTAVGYNALKATTGSYNTSVGGSSGQAITTAEGNFFGGYLAGANDISGSANVGIGRQSVQLTTTPVYEIGIGYLTTSTSAGWANIGIGAFALRGVSTNNTAAYNIGLGYEAGYAITTLAEYNIFAGYRSGKAITTGDNNIFVGKNSGLSVTTGGDNTLLGAYQGSASLQGNVVLSDGAATVRAHHDATAWNFKTAFSSPLNTLTDATNISIDASLSNTFTVTLAGNRTLDNPTNLQSGQSFNIIIKQDAGAGHTLAFGSAYKFPSGVTPTVSPGSNEVDLFKCVTDGTDIYVLYGLQFS